MPLPARVRGVWDATIFDQKRTTLLCIVVTSMRCETVSFHAFTPPGCLHIGCSHTASSINQNLSSVQKIYKAPGVRKSLRIEPVRFNFQLQHWPWKVILYKTLPFCPSLQEVISTLHNILLSLNLNIPPTPTIIPPKQLAKMQSSKSFLLAILALTVPSTLAAPRPQYPIPCDDEPNLTSYSIISQQTNVPGPAVIGDYSTGGGKSNRPFPIPPPSLLTQKHTGNSLTDSSTYSTGITITVGISLNLDPEEIAGNAGISASVATTTTKGISQGISALCPVGGWTCGLSILPQMVEVSGTQFVTPHDGLCPDSVTSQEPYTMLFPVKNADGLSSGNANECTCTNFVDWANPGHPGLLCPDACPE